MIISGAKISSPEDSTLAIWKAHADSLSLLKFLHENPDAIDRIAEKVAAAHKLTQAEKDERQSAIDDVAQAKSALDFLESKCSEAKGSAETTLAEAGKSSQKIIDAAESYKKGVEKELKKRSDDLDEKQKVLDVARSAIAARELATKGLEKNQADFKKQKSEFETDKAEWENDYESRLEKLSIREKKSVKK